jgi:hypothetical protein
MVVVGFSLFSLLEDKVTKLETLSPKNAELPFLVIEIVCDNVGLNAEINPKKCPV